MITIRSTTLIFPRNNRLWKRQNRNWLVILRRGGKLWKREREGGERCATIQLLLYYTTWREHTHGWYIHSRVLPSKNPVVFFPPSLTSCRALKKKKAEKKIFPNNLTLYKTWKVEGGGAVNFLDPFWSLILQQKCRDKKMLGHLPPQTLFATKLQIAGPCKIKWFFFSLGTDQVQHHFVNKQQQWSTLLSSSVQK